MDRSPGITPRHLIAVTALISGVVALYLHFWKIGLAGTLACGAGHGCEIVQFSPWAWFLGVDVALIGAAGYAVILAVALLGTFPRWQGDRRITLLLAMLIVPAFLFTLRLKYYEFLVMKTFCPWCAVSATTITLHVAMLAWDWRRTRAAN